MNTLPRVITARFSPNPDSYNALRKHWSRLINSEQKHEFTVTHHLLYLALLGKDWRKAFTCPTNKRKLENGTFLGWKLFRALQIIQSKFAEQELLAPFDGLVTPQMLAELRKLLPIPNPYIYPVERFANQNFPFDAFLSDNNNSIAIVQVKGTANG